MAQIFHPGMNTVARLTIYGAAFLALGTLGLTYAYMRSPSETQVRVVRDQPVPFSHEHHVDQLGLDCRYCHTSVETSKVAGVPPTHTCMSCHSQIWKDSPMLAPVRESLAKNEPLRWTRVHDLPDYAYFHHGVHVQKGIGCVSCHGRVDHMPMTWKAEPMTMEWCLNCHRHPEKYIRPKDKVFDLGWKPDVDQETLGRQLLQDYHIPVERLTNCSVCHR
jgi:Cytochrome c7 and related cytochrome c